MQEVAMKSGLMYMPIFTRLMSKKETDTDSRRFQVLPSSSSAPDKSHSDTQKDLDLAKHITSEPPRAKRRIAYKTAPSTSTDVIYETSTPLPSITRDVDDDDDDYASAEDSRVESHVLEYGARAIGELASPYVSPYLYEFKKRGLDSVWYPESR